MTPYGGSGWPYHSVAGEKTREALNDWIRHSAPFDGVVNFDKVSCDPAEPEKMLPAYDSGDQLRAFAHCCSGNIFHIRRNAQQLVIPAKAGRSAKHGERPKGGPEGVNEANSLPRKQGREVHASINSTKCRK